VSGRTSASGGNYGWLINFPGVTSGTGIDFPNGSNASFITVEYMEIRGPDIMGFTGDGRGIDDTPGSSSTDHTFSHVKIIGWESGIYIAGTNNHVSEYVDMSHIRSDGVLHPNLYYIIGSSGGIIRHSRFYDSAASGTGIAFSDGGPWNNWTIHGNVFYNMSSASGTAINVQEAAIVGLKLYNNTFYNNAINLYLSGSSCGSGSESKNNLVYGSGGGVSCGTTSNNMTASSNPFVNSAAGDFRIVGTVGTNMPRDKGTALGSAYSVGPDGTVRGADGAWDVGAFEFGGSCTSCTTPPAAPTNVTVIR